MYRIIFRIRIYKIISIGFYEDRILVGYKNFVTSKKF